MTSVRSCALAILTSTPKSEKEGNGLLPACFGPLSHTTASMAASRDCSRFRMAAKSDGSLAIWLATWSAVRGETWSSASRFRLKALTVFNLPR